MCWCQVFQDEQIDGSAWGASAEGAAEVVHLELAGGSPWMSSSGGWHGWISFLVSVFLEDPPWNWLHPEQEIQTLLEPGKVPTKPQGLGEGPELCDSSVS